MAEAEHINATNNHRRRKDVMRVADLVHRQDPPKDSPRRNSHPQRDSEVTESAEPSPQTDSPASQAQTQTPPEPLNPAPSENIHYPSPFPVQRGDWVIRLREGDLSTMPHRDNTDIWDGPFQIIEGPDPKNGHIQLRFPPDSTATRTTDARRLRLVYPVPQMPTRGIFHPEKGVSIYVDKIDFKLKGKKAKTMFIVDRLRGQRVLPGGKLEYLVHWAGWPSEDDTWESSRGLPASVLDEYEKANPASIRRRPPTNSGRRKPPPESQATSATTSEEADSPAREPKPRKKRKSTPAAAAAVSPPLSPKDPRRRTRNSGFIEDLGF